MSEACAFRTEIYLCVCVFAIRYYFMFGFSRGLSFQCLLYDGCVAVWGAARARTSANRICQRTHTHSSKSRRIAGDFAYNLHASSSSALFPIRCPCVSRVRLCILIGSYSEIHTVVHQHHICDVFIYWPLEAGLRR